MTRGRRCGTFGFRPSAYGQVRRTLVIPTNPRTPSQMTVHAHLSAAAKRWRTLSEDGREAWITKLGRFV